MDNPLSLPATAFEGGRMLLSGPLVDVVMAVKASAERGASEPILVFDDATGRTLDFDLRGTRADIVARLSPSSAKPGLQDASAPSEEPSPGRRGRGRPKLGVVGREVTLLPRHWEWLAAQPGGASVALRKLVDEARKAGGPAEARRAAQEAAYRFMSAMAGNLPGFEEAIRALFANDRAQFEQQISNWPEDIRVYAFRLAYQSPNVRR